MLEVGFDTLVVPADSFRLRQEVPEHSSHGLLDCLPPSVRWVHLVHGSHHFLLFFFRYGVVHLLFRVYVMDPSLRRHIAFAGKMSCVSASRAPHVCSTGRNGLPWLPVIRQVDLDSLQRLLEILEHLF